MIAVDIIRIGFELIIIAAPLVLGGWFLLLELGDRRFRRDYSAMRARQFHAAMRYASRESAGELYPCPICKTPLPFNNGDACPECLADEAKDGD